MSERESPETPELIPCPFCGTQACMGHDCVAWNTRTAPSASSARTETTDVLGYAVVRGATSVRLSLAPGDAQLSADRLAARYPDNVYRVVPLVSAATLAQRAERIRDLRETLARWCRQGRSDNGETQIEEEGKRALREFDRELIALQQYAPRSPR